MTNKIELLPCPFCGGRAEQIKMGGYPYSFYVRCKNTSCLCDLGYSDTPEKAMATWNTRWFPLKENKEEAEICEHVWTSGKRIGDGEYVAVCVKCGITGYQKNKKGLNK